MNNGLMADFKTDVMEKLLQLKSDASTYLDIVGVDPEEVRNILGVVDDEVDIDWDHLEYIHALADKDDPNDVYLKIDEAVDSALTVLWSAARSLRNYETISDLNDCFYALKECVELHRVFSTGFIDKAKVDEERKKFTPEAASMELGKSNGGKNSQKKRKMQREGQDYDEHGDQGDDGFITDEFFNLLASGRDVFSITRQIKAGISEEYADVEKFYIRKNGKLNVMVCANYIYEKLHNDPIERGRKPLIYLAFHTTYKKILKLSKEKSLIEELSKDEREKLEYELLTIHF